MKKLDPIRAFEASGRSSYRVEDFHKEIEAAYRAQKFKGAPPATWLPQLAKLLKHNKIPAYAHLAGVKDLVLIDLLDGGDVIGKSILLGLRSESLLRVAKRGGHISGRSRKDSGQIRAKAIFHEVGPGLYTARQVGKAYARAHTVPNSPEYRKLSAATTRLLRRHKVAP